MATPFSIETLATAPDPDPEIVTRLTPGKVVDPLAGVYPIPGFVIVIVPVALAATPTRSPVVIVLLTWEKVLPIT